MSLPALTIFKTYAASDIDVYAWQNWQAQTLTLATNDNSLVAILLESHSNKGDIYRFRYLFGLYIIILEICNIYFIII